MPKSRMDQDDVRKLCELAHLIVTDEERASYAQQLEQILAYAERIQALDTEGVPPTSHALLEVGLEGKNVLRPDEPQESLDRERVLEQAPDAGSGLFKVPKVLP